VDLFVVDVETVESGKCNVFHDILSSGL
jgi:hypothetical protein